MTMTIYKLCPMCNCYQIINVPRDGYMAWREGELIQRAMPTLTATEREALISGLCSDCQFDFFGDENEFEDGDE